jgi:uncharacterized protein (TIGR02246 family)
MNSPGAQLSTIKDEAAISEIPLQLIDAWNNGSGSAFAAPFSENADFVVFEGTHLKGRQSIESFHQKIFDTVVKGSRLEGGAKFIKFLSSQVAVMHAGVRVTLPGQSQPSAGRDSMQIFVVTKRDGDWRVEVVQNSRIVTLQRQAFLDDLDSLSAEAQRQVADLVASLKQRS